MNREIFVNFTVEGIHKWPDATGSVAFLSNPHRHLFSVRVSCEALCNGIEVTRDELLTTAKSHFKNTNWGKDSCETVAEALAHFLVEKYARTVTVDLATSGNEFGALVCVQHKQ